MWCGGGGVCEYECGGFLVSMYYVCVVCVCGGRVVCFFFVLFFNANTEVAQVAMIV